MPPLIFTSESIYVLVLEKNKLHADCLFPDVCETEWKCACRCRQAHRMLVVQSSRHYGDRCERCWKHACHLSGKTLHPDGNWSFRRQRWDAEGICVGRGCRGGALWRQEATEPCGYINGTACQLGVLDSLSAQSPQEVGRSLCARGSARAVHTPNLFWFSKHHSAACFPRVSRVTV